MLKSVAAKARVKPGTTVAVLNRVPGIVESLGLPEDVVFVAPIEAQLVLMFVNSRAELEAQMPPAVVGLAPKAALGLVGIDDTWSAFRLRRAAAPDPHRQAESGDR
ncbi:MAG: hypothetical protein ACYC6T_16200 [Thermoleophilia bacterium]